MPSFIWRETLCGETNLSCHAQLELIVRNLEERKELADEDPDILLVDQRIRELERTPANGYVPVPQAVENDVAMSLNGVSVYRHNFIKGIESDIAESIGGMVSICDASWTLSGNTHRMLLSRLLRNLPRMLMAMTRRPLSASISRTVITVSYKMELPTFFVESVFVAT